MGLVVVVGRHWPLLSDLGRPRDGPAPRSVWAARRPQREGRLFGGTGPGITSLPRCSLIRYLSSGPSMSWSRPCWRAKSWLALPNHDVVIRTPLAARLCSTTPASAWTDSTPTSLL